MADDIQESEGTIIINKNGQLIMAPPGSKSLACKQSYFMNVGDPIVSPWTEYISKMAKPPEPKEIDEL